VFWLVFAVILLIVAVAMGVVQPRRKDPAEGVIVLRPFATIPLVLAVLCLFFSVYRSVGAREVGIPVTFGSVGGDLQSGVHFVAPWTQVTTCPLSEEQSIQNADPRTGDALANQSIPVSGSDQGGATADVTFFYHINRVDAGAIYRAYACDTTAVKAKLVAQNVRSALGSATTGFVSVDLKSHRGDIEAKALSLLRSSLTNFGITSDKVVIGDLILAPNVQDAANAKLAAQQAAQTAQFKLQQAQVDQQTAVVTANGEKAANDAKQQSLTQQILCQDFINALTNPQNKLTVLTNTGPCQTGAGVAGSPVIVNTPAK